MVMGDFPVGKFAEKKTKATSLDDLFLTAVLPVKFEIQIFIIEFGEFEYS